MKNKLKIGRKNGLSTSYIRSETLTLDSFKPGDIIRFDYNDTYEFSPDYTEHFVLHVDKTHLWLFMTDIDGNDDLWKMRKTSKYVDVERILMYVGDKDNNGRFVPIRWKV
jgi:hypothetical protein